MVATDGELQVLNAFEDVEYMRTRVEISLTDDDGDCVLRAMLVYWCGLGQPDKDPWGYLTVGLEALQLSTDHSTGIEEVTFLVSMCRSVEDQT
ncbi:unnamed protein product [Urochloa humidicola]